VPDFAVVGTRPEQSALDRGWSDGENNLAIELTKVVRNKTAGRNNVCGVVRGKVGTHHRPALPLVAGFEDDLAAVVNGLVVEGIDGERRRPVTAILRLIGRGIEGVHPG